MIIENFNRYTELKNLIKKGSNRIRGIVYIIKAGEFYKIGRTSKTIYDRIKALQTGCPYIIEPIAYYEGNMYKILEIQLHISLNEHGIISHNEWYKFKNMDKFIDLLVNEFDFKRINK